MHHKKAPPNYKVSDKSLGRSDFRLSGEVKPGLHPFGLNLLHSVISLKDMRHSLWVQD